MALWEPVQCSCSVHLSRGAFIPELPRSLGQLDVVLEGISEFLRIRAWRVEKVFGLSRSSWLSLKKRNISLSLKSPPQAIWRFSSLQISLMLIQMVKTSEVWKLNYISPVRSGYPVPPRRKSTGAAKSDILWHLCFQLQQTKQAARWFESPSKLVGAFPQIFVGGAI